MPKYRNFYPHKLRIDVIIDYARYDENEAVKDWLLSFRISAIFWPTYSPNLKLIESFWRYLKKRVISNTYDEASSDFTGAILEFCNRSSAERKAMLRQSVEMKLQLLTAT